MRALDILEHFLSRSPWVNREHTVDRIIVGDPQLEADRCVVTWMASRQALERMVDRGIRLMICHEPTFWDHGNDRPTAETDSQAKLAFIKDHGITILRNHDCWDLWPEIGIPWAWAQHLGLPGRPAAGAGGYEHRYDIPARTFGEFARQVAARCAPLGEPRVQAVGNPETPITRIGIGTGCGCHIPNYVNMGCDCAVVCDDGSCYWAGIQRAADSGLPVLRVNHGTSEEPGMVTLTEYINTRLPGLRAEHLPHGACFTLVGDEKR